MNKADQCRPTSAAGGSPHSSSVCHSKRRLEQHELAVARDQKIEHLPVAVAGVQPLAHQQAQVVRERRVGIVDRLVLADHAAQFAATDARARASSAGSVSISSGCTAKARRGASSATSKRDEREARASPYSAGCSAAFAAGFGAPTRRRRSDSDSAPPSIITTAPSQISSTSGL